MSPPQVKTPASAMAKRVEGGIRLQQLCLPKDHLLVAVSGGRDSLALLHILWELAPAWEWRLSVVHVNYGLRGTESEQDAAFVANLCREMGIPFFCESVEIVRGTSREVGTPQKPNSSLQARAREARYTIFRQVAERTGADKIALGHTADDQAETLLLWMLRGAGTTGLAGIPQTRDGVWIRPLLEVSRADVLAYLLEKGLPWRTDSSNEKPVYARNRVRLQLLPVLKELNPAVVKVLGRQARILREEDRCLEQLAIEHLNRLAKEEPAGTYSMKGKDLAALPLALQRRVLRALIRKVTRRMQSPAFGAVEAVRHRVLDGQSGSVLSIAGGLVWRDYERVVFRPATESPKGRRSQDMRSNRIVIHVVEGRATVVPWEPTDQVIRLTLVGSPTPNAELLGQRTRRRAVLDADRIAGPLAVRAWRPGDWFRPVGMHGRRKKLQDYFADIKMSRDDRHRVPLLVAGDEVLWVAGHRADHQVQATSTSKHLLIAELEEAPDRGV